MELKILENKVLEFNKEKYRISIAMCTYNGEKFLKEQLESIERQTVLPDEIIICDDCSTDGTLEILGNVSKSALFSVEIIQNQKNLRSTKNFEKAISFCKGDIIFLCDQDDIWVENKIELMLEQFTNDVGIVFSNAFVTNVKLIETKNDLWSTVGFDNWAKKRFERNDYLTVLLKRNVVTGAAMAFKAQLKPLILPIAKYEVHDTWICLIAAFFTKIKYLDKKLIYYRQHSSQQIGAKASSFSGDFSKAKTLKRGYFTSEIKALIKAITHLKHIKESSCEKNKIAKLDRKLRYLFSRAALRNNGIFGRLLAFKNLFSLDYFRFGNGFKSFLKDIFLR